MLPDLYRPPDEVRSTMKIVDRNWPHLLSKLPPRGQMKRCARMPATRVRRGAFVSAGRCRDGREVRPERGRAGSRNAGGSGHGPRSGGRRRATECAQALREWYAANFRALRAAATSPDSSTARRRESKPGYAPERGLRADARSAAP